MQVPSSIQTALEHAIVQGVFPGAVVAIRHHDRVWLVSSGRLSVDTPGGPVSPSTIYDLASLTKPLATATSLAILAQEGRCRLDEPVQNILPEMLDTPAGPATLRELLCHRAGLPGWRGFYERVNPGADYLSSPEARATSRRQVLQLIADEALVYERGQRSLYSDLGFMLLGFAVERLSGTLLEDFVADRIVRPLKAEPLQYLPTGDAGVIAPTEFDVWRGRVLRGEVHDENAAVLGGVAGHAGLFGTAGSVLAVTGAWVQAYHRQASLLDCEVAREFTRRQGNLAGSSWALGWDTPSSPSSSGQHFSSQSFGHLGYTGTSVWIDPVRSLEVVLVSNRVHPTRKNEAIRSFRPVLHDLVYQEIVGGS